MLRRIFLVLVIGLLLPTAGAAQANLLELVRSDLKADAQAIMTAALDLSDKEGESFWPIYREYETARAQWGDQRVALIKQFAEKFDSLSQADAKSLADQWFKLQEDRLKMYRKYHDKVAKAVNPAVAARFIQVENQLNLVMDIQIAGEMPLVFTADGK